MLQTSAPRDHPNIGGGFCRPVAFRIVPSLIRERCYDRPVKGIWLLLAALGPTVLISCDTGHNADTRHGEKITARPADSASPLAPVPAIPGTYILGSGGALCGKKELETALAYKAIYDGDKAGALSLVARGDVDYLEAGTTVHAFSESAGGLVSVTVMSGTNLAKTCWIPIKMLGAQDPSGR